MSESDKVAQLLILMSPDYEGVITALETLSSEHLTLTFVKNRLLDHEVKLLTANKDTSLKYYNFFMIFDLL